MVNVRLKVGTSARSSESFWFSAGVVDRVCALNGEGQAAQSGVLGQRPDAVHRVGWDAEQVTLADPAFLVGDLHEPLVLGEASIHR